VQLLTMPVGLLGLSVVISVLTGDLVAGIVTLSVITTNSVIGYFTELHAENIIRGLSETSPRESLVLRGG
jgi:magnesium-transporting ATPase (P-type)